MHLSIRDTFRVQRNCSRRELAERRQQLTLYHANCGILTLPHRPPVPAAWCSLSDIVTCLHSFALQRGTVHAVHPWRIIVAVDATVVWQAAATRGDVWMEGTSSCGDWTAWRTWFVVNGRDDASALQELDEVAQLNAQVQAVEGMRLPDSRGVVFGCQVFLTADGKGMQALHSATGIVSYLCTMSCICALNPTWHRMPDLGLFCQRCPAHAALGTCRIVPVA